MYESDQRTKEQFEKWKRSQFSAFDQAAHDEFLKDRYAKNFYKYTATNAKDF